MPATQPPQQHPAQAVPYVASTSSRQLPVHTMVAVDIGHSVGYSNQQHAKDGSQNAKQTKCVRVGMLFTFHFLNMLLGAITWLPGFLLSLLSLPLWCKRDESCNTPSALVAIAKNLATLDIRLANYAAPFLGEQTTTLRVNSGVEAGTGVPVAKVFVYFATVKLLTAAVSFIACYGTVGTVLLATISGGTHVGLPGVHATIHDNAVKYLLLLLLRFVIGCVCVLRSAPRSVMATRYFCAERTPSADAITANV